MRKNFAILNDEDINNLIIIKDDFRTEEEAKTYAEKNNLVGEYYFIGELDDIKE